jgi:hypothetical protein
MTDADVQFALYLVLTVAGLAGFIAGLLGGWLRGRLTQLALRSQTLEVPLQLHAEPILLPIQARVNPVQLPVTVRQPDPVTVELTVAAPPTASLQELAGRVLELYPDIGPTDLAAICQCAKSTAHGLIHAWRATRAFPDRVDISDYQADRRLPSIPLLTAEMPPQANHS